DTELPLVLDGEIVALDGKGRPSFRRLQQRANLVRPRDVERARHGVGEDLVLFDVLRVAGVDVTDLPYDERREILARVIGLRLPVHVPEALPGDASEAMAESRRLGLEGLVAKRRRSGYTTSRRSRDWLKLKHAHTQEVVVVGWRPLHAGSGRADVRNVGSLLLAVPVPVPDGGTRLRYVGKVGTGFRERDRRDIAARLSDLERDDAPLDGVPASEAAHARWTEPTLVGEVEYADWTARPDDVGADDESRLRHAVWRGWRPDKTPQDVTTE